MGIKEKLEALKEVVGEEVHSELVGLYDSEIKALRSESASYRVKAKEANEALNATQTKFKTIVENLGIDDSQDDFFESANSKLQDLLKGSKVGDEQLKQYELKLQKREQEKAELEAKLNEAVSRETTFKKQSAINSLMTEQNDKIGKFRKWVERDLNEALTFDDEGNLVARDNDGIYVKPNEYLDKYLEQNKELIGSMGKAGSGIPPSGNSLISKSSDDIKKAKESGDFEALINAHLNKKKD